MGLGNYEQNLIKSIAENDIREARKWAVAALNADTTQKNKGFVTRYKNILTSEGAGMIELPGNLKDILVCEDVSLSFKEIRIQKIEQYCSRPPILKHLIYKKQCFSPISITLIYNKLVMSPRNGKNCLYLSISEIFPNLGKV